MNLSDIRGSGAPVAQFFFATGGNGHILGRGQIAHAWLVERGHPPIVADDATAWARQYIPDTRRWWRPYQDIPHRQFRTPLCNGLRTTARGGRLNQLWNDNGAKCRECIEIVARLGGPTIHEALVTDPWTHIPAGDRPTTLDPVTGL